MELQERRMCIVLILPRGAPCQPAGARQLIAASGRPSMPEAIRPVISAGQRVFGENCVQESQGKWPALKAKTSRDRAASDRAAARRNKADARALFDVTETVDR